MLISAMLQASLSKIIDPNDPLFTIYPNTTAEAIQNFSNAIDTYAKLVTPVTTPVSQELSKAAFVNVMTPIIVSNSPTFMELFPKALLAYATALGLGMAPAFVGTPPVLPLTLEPVWALGMTQGSSSSQVVTLLSNTIDLWFRTGLAVNTATGATIPWV